MTRIFPASDLHVDFLPDRGESLIKSFPEVDIGVFAGDICQWNILEETLIRLCEKFPEVIYVAGNHEYYLSDWTNVENIIRDCASKLDNLTWLNDDRVKVNGVSFIGSTLWFPDGVDQQLNKIFLSDYSSIEGFEPEVYNRHNDTIDYLSLNVKPDDIVITHHAPSLNSIHHRFYKSALNCYFCNNLDWLIVSCQPSIWIHGHTHDPFDYNVGSTRVLCNPNGYPGGKGCDENLILEI